MAQDYSEYLAAHVLNEHQPTTYRNLSRALKVHSNLAKQMLYDFHSKQNSKKPGSVHATYLLSGTRTQTPTESLESQTDGDSVMQSSPPLPSSSMPTAEDETEEHVPVRSIMLVKEEDLEEVKKLFEKIAGMHIYSLEASGLSDFQVLTECNRRVASDYADEDPLQAWKQYGTIQNSHVRRRTRKGPPQGLPTAPANATTTKATAVEKQTPNVVDASKSNSKPAAVKRDHSGIFKSFAKGAAAQSKKTSSQEAAAPPAPAAGEKDEDVPMGGFSDDDDDDGEDELPAELAEVKAPSGKSKKEREDELRAMMDQEDEPMEDSPPATGEETADKTEEGDGEAQEEPKEAVTVENGRRRGRRRVMKKKTVKDEEGYLVTKEEAAWESFSEEEPAPKKSKVEAPPAASAVANKAPAAKKGGKPGQGNIMSFFGKK